MGRKDFARRLAGEAEVGIILGSCPGIGAQGSPDLAGEGWRWGQAGASPEEGGPS